MHNRSNPTPRVSLIIFGYNQEALVDAAIAGAFAQDYPNLEIVLSDDCSADRTFERMRAAAAAYTGRHRIVVNRTPANRGTLAHAYHAAAKASGELLVMAAADDISYPQRVRRLAEEWTRTGAAALFSKYDVIDEAGCIMRRGYRYDHSNLEYHDYFPGTKILPIHGASSAYAREVFDLIAFPERPILFEDTFFTLCLTLLGRRIAYVDEALVQYREHSQSGTNAARGPADHASVLDYERRGQRYAASMAEVLEEFGEAVRRDPIAIRVDRQALRDDLRFYRLRAGWIDAGFASRVSALTAVRRRAHLRWLLPRLVGVRGLAALKRAGRLRGGRTSGMARQDA